MDDIIIVIGREHPPLLHLALGTVLVTGWLGIAFRLYLLSAVTFDFAGLGEHFRIIFVPLLLLDLVWALCPLLIAHKVGIGLALAFTVALTYLPFSQRTLIRMGYSSELER